MYINTRRKHGRQRITKPLGKAACHSCYAKSIKLGKVENRESCLWPVGVNGIFFPSGTAKCNLFVEHAFNKGNPKDRPFPFTPSSYLLASGIGRMRNFSAKEIYRGRLLNFRRVKKPKPGDIAANGEHVGIVSGKGKTISASIFTGKVVENDWGYRKDKSPAPNMRFFRYTGDDK